MRASGNARMADYAIPEMKDYLKRIGYSVIEIFNAF